MNSHPPLTTSQLTSPDLAGVPVRSRRPARQPAVRSGKTIARDRKSDRGFTIVGIGASAGGLEALTQLLSHLPVNTGMVFVIVQHLDPHRASALAELLDRVTAMPVREVTGGVEIVRNHVYVIPPASDIRVSHGALRLRARPNTRAPHLSIDVLFESLAQDLHERAIGVILSGTATDGTLGLEAIKAEGGITFAQDESAKFDAMPRSAIAAGCVDFILSPAKIAKELGRIAQHPYVRGEPARTPAPKLPAPANRSIAVGRAPTTEKKRSDYDNILLVLQDRCRADFSLYKPNTIVRRINRRMVLGKFETTSAYLRFLQRNPSEIDVLFGDLLIGVTSFFRNTEVFDALKKRVLPRIFERSRDDPIRVWIVGCSSGQEAYSVAMLLVEYADHLKARTIPIQIYATDLSEAALAKARQGLYPKNLVADLSPERLKRFFVAEHGGYRINKMLREMCVFARHNLLSDPPFSRLDLISCRNLLIYLEPALQKQILPSFHYALKPGGFLLLGASESVGTFSGLFGTVDKKEKLYSRKATDTPPHQLRPTVRPAASKNAPNARPASARHGFPAELSAQREADRITLKQYAPPAVVINERLQVLQFRGSTGRYLEPASGKANYHVLQMAREGLMLPLRAALNEARRTKRRAVRPDVRIGTTIGGRTCTLEVTPLLKLGVVCYLVAFKEPRHQSFDTSESVTTVEPAGRRGKSSADALRRETRRSADLERELLETRDYLQSLQEQHESSNEEIQASNEEGQSANEELQSINEELETSKEELESSNEELITLNEEMAVRNADLNRLNSDLNNLHLSINTAILVLSRDLRIRRFTPAAEKAFNLVATDLGRPIGGIRSALNFEGLEPFVLEVIDANALREREVRDNAGKWYLMRIRPYLTLDDEIDGAVLVLIDIDALKRSEHALADARDYAEAILRTARDSLLVLDLKFRVTQANHAYYSVFQTSAKATEGYSLFKISHGIWNDAKLRTLLRELLLNDKAFNDLELVDDAPGQVRKTYLLHSRTMIGANAASPRRFLLSIENITERMAGRDALRLSELRYRRIFEAARDGIILVHPTSRKIVDANPYVTELFGGVLSDLIGKELHQIGLLADGGATRVWLHELRRKGVVCYPDLTVVTKNRDRYDIDFVSNLYTEEGIEIAQCNLRDITVRKNAEAILREHEVFMFGLIEQSPLGTLVVDDELVLLQINPHGLQTLGHIQPLIGRAYPEIVREFWGAAAADEVIRRFEDTLATGENYVSPEFNGRRIDGDTTEIFDWQTHRITRPGGRYCVVCYFSNVTERVRRKNKVVAQARWAELLSHLAAQLILTAAPHSSLGSILDRIASELSADIYLNYAASRDGRTLTLTHSVGWNETQREDFATLRVHEGLGGTSDNLEEQVLLSDVSDPHPDFLKLKAQGAKSYLSHPLRAGSRLLGLLIVVSLKQNRFDPDEVKFLHTICALSSATSERARLLHDTAAARDVAQAANQAKDDFLSAVSHELRTPLNPVLLLASERAEDRSLSLEIRNDFEVIARNVGLEARLVDDLLDLTRSTHAKLALQIKTLDIHRVLADAVAIVQPELAQKKIILAINNLGADRPIQGDALRLQQVFWNVLRNAAKFTPVGGQITVVTALSPHRERLHISVTDTGIGMSPEELSRVFTRFAQGDHAREGGSTRFGGLGLGLSISRTLVEAHGGTIEASSAGRDLGSTFLIDLPVSSVPQSAHATQVTTKAGLPTIVPKRKRMLLVEDHDATRTAYTSLLVRRGYSVMPAVSVAEARALIAEHEFDVIVCDIGLPDGTGYEIMAQLRKGGNVKGIALTGYGSEADVALCLAAGFSGHVTKPVSIQALSQQLAALEAD